MTTPRIDENWQSKFLNKGTELGCGDLSIMIGTVSEILDKVKDEAHQAGIDEAEQARKEGYSVGYAQCCADNNLMTYKEDVFKFAKRFSKLDQDKQADHLPDRPLNYERE